MRSLRSRLFVTTLASLGLALTLTVAISAVLTRRQVDRAQATELAEQADLLALERGSSVSYVNEDRPLSGGGLELIEPPAMLAAYGVSGLDRSSNGTTTFQGRHYLYSYRPLPHRGLLLLSPAHVKWAPFLRGLLIAAIAGVALAALLSFAFARSIVRPIRKVASASNALAAGEEPLPLPEEGSRELSSLTRAFNDMARQLAVSRESERTFLLSVSHELKTPLTAIRGYAEGLGEGAFSPEEASSTILVESQRLERLVHDLLDLARMNRREFAVRREPVDLAEVARETVARHETTAHEFGVELVLRGGETWVEADHDRLLQVASNLVENALRHTPRSGTVTLITASGTLTVSDTGPGLELDDLPRAFERFFLYDKYGRERPVGSGLGLAIVRQLAEAMCGSVSVVSSPGEGASFTLNLPLLTRSPPAGVASRVGA